MRWWERFGAWDERHRLAVDAGGAALLALVLVPGAASLPTDRPAWLVTAFAVATVVALAWRRTRPVASAAAVMGLALAHMLAGVLLVLPTDVLVLVAIYSVTAYGTVWASRVALVGGLVGSLAFGVVSAVGGWWGYAGAAVGAGVLGLLVISSYALGLARRARRERIETLLDQARRLEVERDQQARIATQGERARIAREMHDIVAHSLSVIIAQADGGRYGAAQDPEAATRALTTVAETGRAALADMRRLLGVLRDDAPLPPGSEPATAGVGAPTPAGPAELAPQPAVDDVERLVQQVRDSGVRVSLVRMGAPRRLPPGTGLTVYRICQESLTNILKHAGPDPTATVLLQWTHASLVLEVSDDGRGAAADDDGAGQGVLGMRERAAMLGGTLTTGPRPGGGYRVRAEIPVPPIEETR